jgi:hypothetical protein
MKWLYLILLFLFASCKKDQPVQPIVDHPVLIDYNDSIKDYRESDHNVFFFSNYLFEFEYDEYCAFVFAIYMNNTWSNAAIIFEDGVNVDPYATGVEIKTKTKGFIIIGDLRYVNHIQCTCDTTYLIGNEFHFEIDNGVLYWFTVSELD